MNLHRETPQGALPIDWAGLCVDKDTEIKRLRVLLMKCHQWINPSSDPMRITNLELMTEIETAVAVNT
jgi:hypothetical protein